MSQDSGCSMHSLKVTDSTLRNIYLGISQIKMVVYILVLCWRMIMIHGESQPLKNKTGRMKTPPFILTCKKIHT